MSGSKPPDEREDAPGRKEASSSPRVLKDKSAKVPRAPVDAASQPVSSGPPRSGLLVKLALVPKSDLPLQRSTLSSSSSRFTEKEHARLQKLPSLLDSPQDQELFIAKIRQCSALFDFVDPLSDVVSKEIKRAALQELSEYLTRRPPLPDAVVLELVRMAGRNLFRPLPPRMNPSGALYDPEEDEPVLEAAWPHLQLVYEILIRFLDAHELSPKVAAQYVNESFVNELIALFDTEDPRERDFLKTALHRLYGKVVPMRPYIRKAINNALFCFLYETLRHNGVAELLEVYGSIINGFSLPLKEEHKQTLQRVLLPLHKAASIGLFHPQLSYCVTQYLEKDPHLARVIFTAVLRYWPRTSSHKELLFLAELEDLIRLLDEDTILPVLEPAFKQLAACISSPHFQVAERALFFFNNEAFVHIVTARMKFVLPVLFDSLYYAAQCHWNASIRRITLDCLKLFRQVDADVYMEVIRKQKETARRRGIEQSGRAERWRQLELLAEKRAQRQAQVQPPEPLPSLPATALPPPAQRQQALESADEFSADEADAPAPAWTP